MSNNVYLYLDIDGVLNSVNSLDDDLSSTSLDILKQLHNKYQYTTIISSTWRLNKESKQVIVNALTEHKIVLNENDILYTPDLGGYGTRTDEIIESVKTLLTNTDLLKFVIIDDMDLLCSENKQLQELLQPHTVLIDGGVGLCQSDIPRIDAALSYYITDYEQFKQVLVAQDYTAPKFGNVADRNEFLM